MRCPTFPERRPLSPAGRACCALAALLLAVGCRNEPGPAGKPGEARPQASAESSASAPKPALEPAHPADSTAPPPAPKPRASSPARPPVIHDIQNRLDLRGPFDADRGKVRLIAFLSPTCSHCYVNAQALQNEVLDTLPDADLVVYVVWLKVLDKDERAAIDAAATVLRDPRIRHYWDPKHTLNAQLLDAIYVDVQVRMYNVFLLYDRNATWDTHLPRPGYWMQDYRGVRAPQFKAATLAEEIRKALRGEPLDTPPAP